MLATATLSALCFSAPLLPRTMPHGRVALAMSERGGENPLSTEAIQVLAKWGPEAYLKKIDVDEYEEDVAKVLAKWPRTSRALAEQEVNWKNSDLIGYMAAQSQERQAKGPQEKDLYPPVSTKTIVLSALWALISISFIVGVIAKTFFAGGWQEPSGNYNLLCGKVICPVPQLSGFGATGLIQ